MRFTQYNSISSVPTDEMYTAQQEQNATCAGSKHPVPLSRDELVIDRYTDREIL